MDSDTPVNACGCCEKLAGPAPVSNDPGLPALEYRVDTQPGFYERMLSSLPLARADADEPGSPRPLRRLLARTKDDPTVAFVDACACVADVLTFYQERIANEGFLRTAVERRSVLELARAIGYELNPGVAAGVHLSFLVEDAPGAPGICTLVAGTPVQSIPEQGKLPQVFETSSDLVARAEWNALVPRQTRPADMAIIDVTGDGGSTRKALALLGPAGSFPPDTPNIHKGLINKDLFHLDPALAVDQTVDAIEVGRVFVPDTTTGIAVGDMLLFVGKRGTDLVKLVLRVMAAVTETALKRLRLDVEPLPDPVEPVPPPVVSWIAPYALQPFIAFAKPKISPVAFTSSSLTSSVVNQAWKESDLKAMIGIQGWNSNNLVKAVAKQPTGPPIAPEAGAFAFGAKLGFFGNNAPKWGVLPSGTNINANPYKAGWDPGDNASGGGTLSAPRTIWTDSQGNAIAPSAYLERAVPGVSRGGWTVLDAPEVTAEVYGVFDARETARADYGLSGRAMALTLANDSGAALTTKPSTNFPFRSTTAYLASRQLALAELPIEVPIAAGDTTIELDRMTLGLSAGQPIALTGKRSDLPGVDAAEVAVLADIIHAAGRTTLVLKDPLVYSYVRTSLTISANVVHATHGETVSEVLGSGDASQPNQSFTLKKPPTTFLSAPTPSGVINTLEVRVNGVRWDERSSLYDAVPADQVYITRIDDDARMRVTFGDGVRGARLPTGQVNVSARYRSGIGPDGEVGAGSITMLRKMPLGLRGVTNPLPAAGADGPETLDGARRNAPLTMLTFERVVSLLDYENYARAYPGIGKARADVLWIAGEARVHLTVAGATGGPPGPDVLANLIGSVTGGSDPSQRFAVAAYGQRYFTLSAALTIDPRYRFADVQAATSAALLTVFGFDARDIAQSVTAAEIMALAHTVPGVVSIDIVELLAYSDSATPPVPSADAVPAFAARYDTASGSVQPADLLLINPAGITLSEVKP